MTFCFFIYVIKSWNGSLKIAKPTNTSVTIVNLSLWKIRFLMVALILLRFTLLISAHVFRGYSTTKLLARECYRNSNLHVAKYIWSRLRLPRFCGYHNIRQFAFLYNRIYCLRKFSNVLFVIIIMPNYDGHMSKD